MPDAIRRLPAPVAVLFDLDGTLVDTVAIRIEAWSRVFARYAIPAERSRIAQLIGIDGRRLAREIAALAGTSIDDAQSEEIDRVSGEIYAELNEAPRPLPGVRRLVDELTARGIRWAIATSSRREQVAVSVAALELPAEPAIVDGSHVERAKPEPDLLLLAAERLSVDPARCWYVGDSTWDMTAAIAAGMVAIGVTAGTAVDRSVLEGVGAALVVRTLDELVEVLRATV